jgi:hypothetical protein
LDRILLTEHADLQMATLVIDDHLMKDEYDFSIGERAGFYHPDAVFSLPVYLEPDVSDYMSQLADEKNVQVQDLVNEWLRADIRLVQSVRRDGTD